MLFCTFVIASLASLSKIAAGAAVCDREADAPREPVCHGSADVYHVKGSLGKGLGVFALHDMDVGDVVMREAPILKVLSPHHSKGAGSSRAIVAKAVEREFQTLSPAEQAHVLSLAHHVTVTEEHAHDQLHHIFQNNAYSIGDSIGLFPRIARINHSCRPNTSYHWNKKLNKQTVYATRKIKAGEEFFVSYIPLLFAHQERQKQLDRYHFQCYCEACSQKGAIRDASDARRTTIKEAFELFEPQLTLRPPQSEAETQQAFVSAEASAWLARLVREEGLAEYYSMAYRIAAVHHARVEDWKSAASWASKGYELRFIEDPESVHTAELRQLAHNFTARWQAGKSEPPFIC